MKSYNETRLASIAAYRSGIDRATYLASVLPEERSNAALVYDRTEEFDTETKTEFTEDDILFAQSELYKTLVLAAIIENDGCGYRDLAYRYVRGARLSAGASARIESLGIQTPTRDQAIAYLTEVRAARIAYLSSRYGLQRIDNVITDITDSLVVNLAGNWRLYTQTLPIGGRAIGTVTRDGYDTGALVLMEDTGIYVQVNINVIRNLPQSKVEKSLAAVL